VDHLAPNFTSADDWFAPVWGDRIAGRPERVELGAAGYMSCGRREKVAAVKGAAQRASPILPVLQPPCLPSGLFPQYQGEKAVIGSHKKTRPGPNGDGAALGPHPGVHNRQMDGPMGEILITSAKNKGPGANALRGDEMGYVHQLRIRTDLQDDPFHAGCISVLKPKIGQQSDYL